MATTDLFLIYQRVRLKDGDAQQGHRGTIELPPSHAGRSELSEVWVSFDKLPAQWVDRARLEPIAVGRTSV